MDHVRVGGGASNETLGAKQMDTVQLIGGFGVAYCESHAHAWTTGLGSNDS